MLIPAAVAGVGAAYVVARILMVGLRDYYLAEVSGFGLTAFVFIYLAARR